MSSNVVNIDYAKMGALNRFLALHSRLLMVIILAGAAILGYREYSAHTADLLIAKNQADQALLKSDAVNSAKLAQQAADQANRYAALVVQLEQQNAGLQQAIAARNTATKVQQEKDKTLPPDELARHWIETEALLPGDVRPTTDGEFAVTMPAARQTVSDLDALPAAIKNMADESQMLANKTTQNEQLNSLLSTDKLQIAALNVQLTDNKKACNDAVLAQKAKDKKSKRMWFVKGLTTGAIVAWRVVKFF